MKIDPVGPKQAVSARRVGAGKSATGDSFAKALDAGQPAAGLTGAAGVTAPSAILALQEVPEATDGLRRAKRRGEDILDRLDELRLALLEGSLSPERLEALARLVRQQRGQVVDPRLTEILDDIELRAAVELAKLAPRG